MRNRTIIPKIRRKYLKRIAAKISREKRWVQEVEDKLDGKKFDILKIGINSRVRLIPIERTSSAFHYIKRDGSTGRYPDDPKCPNPKIVNIDFSTIERRILKSIVKGENNED
jgi:hypothetical protein